MNSLINLTRIARSPGDPQIQEAGPSSLLPGDRLTRALGWFSLALGVAELVAPGRITRALGLEGKEGLVRAYGAREIAAGIPTLSMDKHVGLASRVVGDVIDIATLLPALRPGNPKRGNALLALGAVAAVTALDVIAATATVGNHRRDRGRTMDYGDRSGLPRGVMASRGLARGASTEVRRAA
ncbi:MAG: hypothetical protein U1E23_01970 [Reyranellaceae bacterium]